VADFARGLRPVLVSGARVSRTGGICALCQRQIWPGDREAELPADGGWCHVACLARRPG